MTGKYVFLRVFMSEVIKIIHTGDVHLDSPFSGLSPDRAEMRKTELRATFDSLISFVRSGDVDILLIAGDLFDSGFATHDTVELLRRGFEKIPDCKIIISPGNHDPYVKDSVYARAHFPKNVYIFKTDRQERFEFPELDADIYGYAFTGETMTECPIAPVIENDRFKILCAHAHLGSPLSPSAPLSTEKLLRCGFDYAALAHVHNPPPIAKSERCVYGYCGCLEGRGFDERGEKGAIYAELSKNESGEKKIEVRKIPFAKRRYEIAEVNVTGSGSEGVIISKINDIIMERGFDESTALRAVLKGRLSPSVVISEKKIAAGVSGVFSLGIKDETTADFDDDYLASDPTIKGEFYRILKPQLESPDENVRRRAMRALGYGMAAMTGDSISDVTEGAE